MQKQFTRIILHLRDPEMSYLKIVAKEEGRTPRDQALHILRSNLKDRAKKRLPHVER